MLTLKASGEVCICVNLIKWNQSIKREAHPLPSVNFTEADKLLGSNVFSRIDANSAFSKESLLIALINPLGKVLFQKATLWYIKRQ